MIMWLYIAFLVFILIVKGSAFLHSVDHTPRQQPSPRVTNVDIKEGDRIVVCPHCHRTVSKD